MNDSIDEAFKIYKKDKSLKKIFNVSSKKALEEKLQDAAFINLLKQG